MKTRIIFHVDVNSAFLSWEAVHRLENGDTLDLREVPSAVGGDVKSRHGIITAKSIPAKAYGVTTGEPVTQALRKCPNLILVPSTRGLYSKCSAAFMKICREYTPDVEKFSVDECFMDMTRMVPGHDGAEAVRIANELKDRIRAELKFTVNIGISENKLLAKMASDFRKPDRVHTLWPEEIEAKMWPLPCQDLLFVGKSSAERLKTLGIRTIGDIAKTPEAVLKGHFGEKGAASLHRSACGIDDSPVHTEKEDEKSYGHSTTLPNDITDEAKAYRVLQRLSDAVCSRMRKDNVRAGLVTVHYRSNDFNNYSRQKKLDYTTYAADLIYREAVNLFNALWDGHTPIRLLGVTCGNLSDGTNEQIHLFMQEEKEKHEKLDRMLDEIRGKYGDYAVKRATDAW